MTSINPGGPDPRDPYTDGRGTNRGWGCTWWWWVVAILLLLLVFWWAAFGWGRYADDVNATDPAPPTPVEPAAE